MSPAGAGGGRGRASGGGAGGGGRQGDRPRQSPQARQERGIAQQRGGGQQRGAAGQQRGAAGQQRGAAGQQRGAAGLQRGGGGQRRVGRGLGGAGGAGDPASARATVGRSSPRPAGSSAPAATKDPAFRGRRRRDESLGGEQIEGRRAVRELLVAARREVREIWISEGRDPAAILEDIAELARAARVPIRMVGEARLSSMARTDAPQGVIAFAQELTDHTLEELVLGGDESPGSAVLPFLVVLDGITDPHNLGALLRTAACAGATGAVVGRHHAVHVTPTAAKAAAGAVERLPMASVPGIPAALQELSRMGVWTVGLDAGADRSLFDLDLATSPVALVLGSEGKGLKRLTRERCDVVAGIPMFGELDSLNVSAAGAVACFEVARRRAAGR